MMKNKKVWALALSLGFTVVTNLTVLANSLESRLSTVQDQAQSQKSKIAKAQQEVDSISEQLRNIQMELDAATNEYKAIKVKLGETEQKIEENEIILAKAQKSFDKRKVVLNKRLCDVYENGQLSYVDVLLGANDFNDLISRMDLLTMIMKHDVNLFSEIKAERELILNKKAELENDKQAIQVLEQAAEEKKAVVELRKQERKELLDNAVSERDSAEQAYQELLQTSRQIEQMIRASQGHTSGAVQSTGRMIWPLNGPITSPYGWRTHPIFGTARYHSGIDIGADYGENISAADSGTVIFAGWMGGYGYAVIIDHGGGISSLYGHNSELTVSEGQQVRQGQVIALAGSTGYSTGPHCHFEVRQNGEPVDPSGYL